MPTSYKEKSAHNINNFIGYLRSLDERAKKIWISVFSGISMLIVVALWVLYINVTVKEISSPALEQVASVTQIKDNSGENPLLANFKRNSAMIYGKLKGIVVGITHRGNEIIIEKNK